MPGLPGEAESSGPTGATADGLSSLGVAPKTMSSRKGKGLLSPGSLVIVSDGDSPDEDSLLGLAIRSPTLTPRSTRKRTGFSGSPSSAVAAAGDRASMAAATATARRAIRRGCA